MKNLKRLNFITALILFAFIQSNIFGQVFTKITTGPVVNNVKIEVSNYLGQFVTELYNAPSGNNDLQIRFDTKNLSSGLYFIKTTYGGQVAFKKLVIEH